jgi:hypothetical protein
MMRTHPDLHVTKIGLGPLNRRDHARTVSSTQDTSSCKSETLSNTRVGLRNGHSRPYWEATTNVAEGDASRCILQRLARVSKGQPQGPLRVTSGRGEIGPSRDLQARVGAHGLDTNGPQL